MNICYTSQQLIDIYVHMTEKNYLINSNKQAQAACSII